MTIQAQFLFALVLSLSLLANSSVNSVNGRPLPVYPLSSANQIVLTPATLGVVINLDDPDSVLLGEYYIKSRGVPKHNIFRVHFPVTASVSETIFLRELETVTRSPDYPNLAGFALAFGKPYRLGENQSITSAFSQGIATVAWHGNCNLTVNNPDNGAPPGASLTAKPAMLLYGGDGYQSSVKLIERGIAADTTDPSGVVMLLRTSDRARSSPREASMKRAAERFENIVDLEQFADNAFPKQGNVVGLQIGMPNVPNISAVRFLPGAYADNLTSFGGVLTDNNSQTTVAEFIRNGATASFGTVREPCNFAGKFPDPERMAINYLNGDSVLEAYWKSLDMATEGLIVGEPLARPFPLMDARWHDDILTLRTNKQTLRYLRGFSTANHGTTTNVFGTTAAFEVGIYDVRSGRPYLIKGVTVSSSSQVGDLIAEIRLHVEDARQIVLGILPR